MSNWIDNLKGVKQSLKIRQKEALSLVAGFDDKQLIDESIKMLDGVKNKNKTVLTAATYLRERGHLSTKLRVYVQNWLFEKVILEVGIKL